MPCLMHKLAVGTYGINLHTHFFELLIFGGKILELRRANECKVCRIEEEYCPLPFDVFVSDSDELVIVICLNFEFRHLLIDYWFHLYLVFLSIII